MQRTERFLVESSADAAGINQLLAAVVIAQQEGTKVGAAAGWLGEAADDELLALRALDLEPVEASARFISRTPAFADDPFKVQMAGLFDDFFAGALDRIAEA